MDPTCTLEILNESIRLKDWPAVEDAAMDLAAWLHRGGFRPLGEIEIPPAGCPLNTLHILTQLSWKMVS